MLPPRYLLREDVVVRLVDELAPRRVCEIGCGGGEILLTLARRGYQGVGFDPSTNASEQARRVLADAHQAGFEIVDAWPAQQRFDLVLLLEVIGYTPDPLTFLRECHQLVSPGGSFIISFVPPNAGYSPRVVDNQKCFAPLEMRSLLSEAGFSSVRVLNYGFPLANALVPIFNLVHGARFALTKPGTASLETGLGHTSPLLQPAGLISNRLTIKPFAMLQRLFEGSELGTGFVACGRVAG